MKVIIHWNKDLEGLSEEEQTQPNNNQKKATSTAGDIQNLTEQDPEYPALASPTLSRRLKQMSSGEPFPVSVNVHQFSMRAGCY